MPLFVEGEALRDLADSLTLGVCFTGGDSISTTAICISVASYFSAVHVAFSAIHVARSTSAWWQQWTPQD